MAYRSYPLKDGSKVYCAFYFGPDGRRLTEQVCTVPPKSTKDTHKRARQKAELHASEQRAAVRNDTWTDPTSGETYTANIFAPVWRWRQAFFNDFAARADWCIQPFDSSNHAPILSVDGDASSAPLRRTVAPGGSLELDASASSDPDGDGLAFSWWFYREPGTPCLDLTIDSPTSPRTRVTVPTTAGPGTAHLILEVTDRSSLHPLTRYRRILLEVTGP